MRIVWDALEDRSYSEGISQGVLFPGDGPGVAWNGLISVAESGESNQVPRYFDGQKYSNRNSSSSFSGTISAFTYPDELEPFIGVSGILTGQNRRFFGLSYRTNDEIHIIYNVLTAPSRQTFSSAGSEISPAAFEWGFSTKPVKIPGGKPSSHIVILISESKPSAISELEALIYGNDTNDSSLPSVSDILELFEASAELRITDHGDGTWTALGPDNVITVTGDMFTINWPSVVIVDSTTFQVSSL
jgi:hypothetical protein